MAPQPFTEAETLVVTFTPEQHECGCWMCARCVARDDVADRFLAGVPCTCIPCREHGKGDVQ